jgi:hypothetical protein
LCNCGLSIKHETFVQSSLYTGKTDIATTRNLNLLFKLKPAVINDIRTEACGIWHHDKQIYIFFVKHFMWVEIIDVATARNFEVMCVICK